MNNEELVKIILQKSKEIQDVLNKNLLPEFCKLHNIKEEYCYLEAKQEVIAKRAYFLDVKKKYALWIINTEGVPTDEYDIKGLVTKRSDYSSFTREFIFKLIDFLLKYENISFTKIKEFIDDTNKKCILLINEGSKEIAAPVTFTKPLSEYKTIPSHINAMTMWNILEYNYFTPGTKGYEFIIKGVDEFIAPDYIIDSMKKHNITKFDRIILPYEMDKLPEYYIPDNIKMLEKVWINRYTELLSPIIQL